MGSLILTILIVVLVVSIITIVAFVVVNLKRASLCQNCGETNELTYSEREQLCISQGVYGSEKEKFLENYVNKCSEECPFYKKCRRYNSLFKAIVCVEIVVAILLIPLMFSHTIKFNSINMQGKIEGYLANKAAIEQSVENDKLTGLDRFELVKQAIEKNDWLAKQKAKMKKWTSFNYSKEVKEILLDLEYISF